MLDVELSGGAKPTVCPFLSRRCYSVFPNSGRPLNPSPGSSGLIHTAWTEAEAIKVPFIQGEHHLPRPRDLCQGHVTWPGG